jgi:hypothetical protein
LLAISFIVFMLIVVRPIMRNMYASDTATDDEMNKAALSDGELSEDVAKPLNAAKVVEPEVAVAQAMDGMMPPDDKPRLDSARAQALNSLIMRSLAQRQRAADLITAKRLDAKDLGIDVMKDPIAKVNQAIAARFDSEYAKPDANPAEIEAALKLQHAALKNESANRADSVTGAAKGYDFMRFNGLSTEERRDSAGGGGKSVKATNSPLGSCLAEKRPS